MDKNDNTYKPRTLSQPKQRAAISAAARFLAADKTAGSAAGIKSLALGVVDPLSEIEPYHRIAPAMPLRLGFGAEGSKRNCGCGGDANCNHRNNDHGAR